MHLRCLLCAHFELAGSGELFSYFLTAAWTDITGWWYSLFNTDLPGTPAAFTLSIPSHGLLSPFEIDYLSSNKDYSPTA
jgi:hypothetical protein